MSPDDQEAPGVIREWATVPSNDWRLLFGGDPDPFGIEHLQLHWRPKDTHFVLYLDGRAASHVSVLREHRVRVGSAQVDVTGVAGVITRPELRRRGLASRLLAHVLRETRERGGTGFALLFCLSKLIPLYRGLGWSEVSSRVHLEQPSGVVVSPLRSMVLALGGAKWPEGDVWLGSAPW